MQRESVRVEFLKKRFIINLYKYLHEKILFSGRCNAIIACLESFFPDESATVLDLGCGDGRIAQALIQIKSHLRFLGLEIQAREHCAIDYKLFDGKFIPFNDNSFDYVLLVDVLHHTNDYAALLKEAARVAKKAVIIKDHYAHNRIDFLLLAIADWVGNWSYAVPLPYNYKNYQQWQQLFRDLNLNETQRDNNITLYSFPFSIIFRKRLQFIAKLVKN